MSNQYKTLIVNKMRLVLTSVIAPIAAIYVMPIGFCFGLIIKAISQTTCFVAFSGYSWYGFFIVFPATLFLAAPLFFVFYRKGWLKWWQISLGGASVGLLMGVLLYLLDSGFIWYRFSSLSTPIGFFSGFIFWIVGIFHNTKLWN